MRSRAGTTDEGAGCPAKDADEAGEAAPEQARSLLATTARGALQGSLRHPPLAILVHHPEVDLRIQLHLSSPVRFNPEAEVVDANVR